MILFVVVQVLHTLWGLLEASLVDPSWYGAGSLNCCRIMLQSTLHISCTGLLGCRATDDLL
jgi:hypothetical protein